MYGLRCCKKNKIIMKNTLQTNINDDNISKEIIDMFNELEVEDINEINKLKNV
jgi:hypothetical protein|tara:strand:+ start:152 stop:310 length:159 start_codon:yes stop_codon:yes gene_type:complete